MSVCVHSTPCNSSTSKAHGEVYLSHTHTHTHTQVGYNDKGLEAIIFTAEGDMRQALNNLQSTFAGFGFVSEDNVFKVHTHLLPFACPP